MLFPIQHAKRSGLSDTKFDYTGGFNRMLLGLADALPVQAFAIRNR
jgi:hypothetical protein